MLIQSYFYYTGIVFILFGPAAMTKETSRRSFRFFIYIFLGKKTLPPQKKRLYSSFHQDRFLHISPLRERERERQRSKDKGRSEVYIQPENPAPSRQNSDIISFQKNFQKKLLHITYHILITLSYLHHLPPLGPAYVSSPILI